LAVANPGDFPILEISMTGSVRRGRPAGTEQLKLCRDRSAQIRPASRFEEKVK
jgi:hypothetical protein